MALPPVPTSAYFFTILSVQAVFSAVCLCVWWAVQDIRHRGAVRGEGDRAAPTSGTMISAKLKAAIVHGEVLECQIG